MRKLLFIFSVLFLFCGVFQASAQGIFRTEAEYKDSIPVFENWLYDHGLDSLLSVESFAKQRGKDLFQLYLEFVPRYDSVPDYWYAMDDKLRAERGYGLDSLLYFAALNTFQIPPDNFNIIIYDSYLGTAHDTVGIYYSTEEKAIKSYISLYRPKGQTGSRTIVFPERSEKATHIIVTNLDDTRVEIYKRILLFARNYFRAKIQGDFSDNFTVFSDEHGEQLQVLITGLRNQIIEENNNPWVAQMANYFLDAGWDWNRTEGILFTVKVNIESDNKVALQVRVDARYGSGMWEVNDWDRMQNFEPEFETEVRKYANKMAGYIKIILLK